jgi:hypothetical protein
MYVELKIVRPLSTEVSKNHLPNRNDAKSSSIFIEPVENRESVKQCERYHILRLKITCKYHLQVCRIRGRN